MGAWMMIWLAGTAGAADLDFELWVGDATVEGTLRDLRDGDVRELDLGAASASVTFTDDTLAVTVSDERGRVLASPTLEVGSGRSTRLTAPSPAGVVHLSVRLRKDEVRCEALRNPSPDALQAALERTLAGGGTPQVFAGSATVREGGSSVSGAAMWVCAW